MADFYQPGTIAPYTSKEDSLKAGIRETSTRRNLTSEEFEYYYSNMTNEDQPIPVRIAVAVGLKADLVSLYGSYYSRYKDPLIESWAAKAEELSGEDLAQFTREINAFESFQFSRPVEGEYSDKTRDTRNAFWRQLATQEKEKDTEAKVQELIAREDLTRKEAKDKVEEEKSEALIKQMAYEFMKTQIRDYLTAIFQVNPVSLIMNKRMSDNEYWFRMKLIKSVEDNLVKPTTAIASYQKALNFLMTDPSPGTFKATTNIYLGDVSHPMMRYTNG